MTHQLVFQFEASTEQDFRSLVELSEAVREALPDSAILDGHDFGLGEFNIFIHTSDPESLFEPVCNTIAKVQPELAFSAGYRNFEEDRYTALWPPNSTTFSVA
ncbi:MAG: ABC transporter [Edaphobacter sp.]